MELRDVQSALRAGIESRATQVGPFLVLLNEKSPNPFHNYAVPVDGAAPTAADTAALVAFFADHDRMPRLEYVRPAPPVDSALSDAGFDVTATLTLMALTEFTPAPDTGFRVEFVTSEADLRVAIGVQNTAYGEADAEPDPAGLIRTVANGGCVALAFAADGTPAGSGLFSPPRGGLVEIAAVGVPPEHRRQGVGRLVTSALTQAALAGGHEPFLQVEKDEPQRLYERIGYRVIGDMADARRS